MWSHTRSLECLVLVATVAPAELVRVATAFGPAGGGGGGSGSGSSGGRSGGGSGSAKGGAGAGRGRAAWFVLLGAPAAYLVVTGLALAVAASGGFTPDTLTRWRADALWLPAAAVVGAALVGAEFLTGAVPRLLQGTRGLRLAVHRSSGVATAGYAVAILATAVAEELLYRGLWIGLLHQRLELPTGVAIAVGALAYALGHLFFGGLAVVQKTLSGAVFGVLLVASGSLAVPLVAHLAQNAAVHLLAVRQERGAAPRPADGSTGTARKAGNAATARKAENAENAGTAGTREASR
ncbi:type II CAAX endopeptidase family protein [Kitasatospora sp. CM 4170]|uniref:Type II CAAX endopeptidase family protein n=1 Tax=Kitasatospora aburaviensis TaxID=67265 RepID=A0ABW1F443_9ACTN|nr:type II CAAX endopeptidase family protein [Kitasatospora sp. CM 4170]WNM43277.1 type II CAAX endopeptidase family protein [Kitasatospora sp. CM 4170]